MVKNIVFVTPYFAPAWSYGGPPKVLHTLASELVRKGKKVKVITCDTQDLRRNTKLREEFDGIEVFRFQTVSNTLSYKLKLFIVPHMLSKTNEILKWADVVLFSDVRTIINWQLYPFVLSQNIPYGIFSFGEIPRGYGLRAIVKYFSDKFWVDDFVKKATFRFAQTSHEQEMYHACFDIPLDKTQLLSIPVDQEAADEKQTGLSNFKNKWQITDHDRIILFVGRLHYLKGIDIIINSVSPCLEENHSLKLMIVGRDDGEEKKLKNMINSSLRKQIIFTGPLYEKEVINAYKCASLFLFTPRFYEETSLAALMALRYGIPVITTYEAEIPYLEDYQAGFLVENNIVTIREAVIKLLKMKNNGLNSMKKQAKQLITNHFTSDKITIKLLSYIETII